MQIAIWSDPNTTVGTSTMTAALATVIAARYGYKTLMCTTMTRDLSLLSYCSLLYASAMNHEEDDLGESDMDRLLRLIQHGKLTAADIPNYCYSLLSHSNLDMLGSYRTYEVHQGYEVTYRYLLHQARQFYELVMVDLDRDLSCDLARGLLEESEGLIVVLPPNEVRQKHIIRQLDAWYKDKVTKMEISFIVNGIPQDMSIRKREIAKRCSQYTTLPVTYIPYHTPVIEQSNEHQLVDYLLRHSHDHRRKGENTFLDTLEGFVEGMLAHKEVQTVGQ